MSRPQVDTTHQIAQAIKAVTQIAAGTYHSSDEALAAQQREAVAALHVIGDYLNATIAELATRIVADEKQLRYSILRNMPNHFGKGEPVNIGYIHKLLEDASRQHGE